MTGSVIRGEILDDEEQKYVVILHELPLTKVCPMSHDIDNIFIGWRTLTHLETNGQFVFKIDRSKYGIDDHNVLLYLKMQIVRKSEREYHFRHWIVVKIINPYHLVHRMV